MTAPEKLLAAYLDDALSAAEQVELAAWLKADPANLRRFVEANLREQQLREAVQARGQLLSFAPTPAPDRIAASPRRTWRRARWVAAAAAVLLASFLTWLASRPAAVDVEVLEAGAARLAGESGAVDPGRRISLRVIELATGTLRLRLPNEVVLDVAGPALARFESPSRLRVERGHFTAEVGPRGKGFTIETAQARIVDLGTRFGVDASAAAGTDVVVFAGAVKIYEPAARGVRGESGLIARLGAGEAMRLDSSQHTSRIVFIVQGRHDADWASRSDPPPGAVIAHVDDNRGIVSSQRFYRVSTGGMAVGVPARHGQRARWYSYEGNDLPAWLEGADLVETFGLDKFEENFALTVTLARPALLCVFQDARVPPPEWLAGQFTDSGFQLQIKRAPDDRPVADVPFRVWTRPILTSGPVVLGPPRSAGAGERGRMYGVAASPLDPAPAR